MVQENRRETGESHGVISRMALERAGSMTVGRKDDQHAGPVLGRELLEVLRSDNAEVTEGSRTDHGLQR